jgi:hypothetical protein
LPLNRDYIIGSNYLQGIYKTHLIRIKKDDYSQVLFKQDLIFSKKWSNIEKMWLLWFNITVEFSRIFAIIISR